MSTTITIEEAQARLPEVIDRLAAGEEVSILRDGRPVARLTRDEQEHAPRQPGSAKDQIFWMAPDFDAPLEEFREYME